MSAPMKWMIATIVAALLALPSWGSAYAISFLVSTFMYVALAGSWNLFSGMTGYVSLGQGLFFGAGAYAFGVSTVLLHWHPAAGIVLAGAVIFAVLPVVRRARRRTS